ncbi:MAG: hypothetical protein CMM56_05520 [Rhodospirillaceae bacterium]|nr:hypothetical protein [Rhodospirillaceae bacterium]
MKHRFQNLAPIFLASLVTLPALAQDTNNSTTIAEITQNSDRIEGLFTLYRDRETGSTHMEISPKQLNQEYIYVAVSTDGVVEGGHFRGRYRDNRILSLKRYFDKVEIRSENTAFYFNPESPLSRAASANISSGLLASLQIDAEDEVTGNILIKVDDVFSSEALLQVKATPDPDDEPGDSFKLGELSDEKSKITGIRNYPLNTDVHVEYVYENPTPIVRGDDEITDSRYVSIFIQHSFMAVPKNNYVPRLTDHRMGFFAQQVTDLTDGSVTPYRDLVERWHLVKKNPSEPISEPIEPIIWWIENTTPIEFRDSIKEGVLAWNQAFEKIGFNNALVVKVQPDDAEWDAEDIRYNVLRWTSSPTPPFSGYGPSFTNPRTGQIIGADIMLEFAGVTRRLQYQRVLENLDSGALTEFFEAGYCNVGYGMHISQAFGRIAINSMQLGSAQEEQLIHEFLVDLTMHEIGHTLGFAHNFAASNLLTYEEIYDPAAVNKRSLHASVMDYTDIHIATEGREQTAYFGTKPGPYDDWIVEYSYSSALENPQMEAERLASIASRSTETSLLFGTDDHVMRAPGVGMDPRIHWYDMTSEPIRYAEDRLNLIENLLQNAREKNITVGESYQELRDAYVIMLSQFSRSIGVLMHQIGGVHINRSVVGQLGSQPAFVPVDSETQNYAMSVLTDHLFAPDVLSASKDLYANLQEQRRLWNFYGQTEDPKIHQWILSVQNNVLDHLLHPTVMTRITDSRLYGNEYELADMMADLTSGIFDDDLRGDINTFRQNLQIEYVSRLINIIESPEHDYPSKSMSLYQLRDIERMLSRKRRGNIETQAHTANIIYLIGNALEENT